MRSNFKYICLRTIFGALEGSVRITDEYLKLVRRLGEEVMSEWTATLLKLSGG